jgi:ribonuclease III
MDTIENFVRKILKRGISDKIIDKILENYIEIYHAVFTTKEVDKEANYEFFEQLGDLTINKFIVTYTSRKFPHLKSSNGVGILAKVRILYASKDELSKLSEKLGFNKYIICTKEEAADNNKMMSILEDVFEAFWGATEFILNKMFYNEIGYTIIYNILESIYNEIDININYENLVDFKSRLNELKDEHKIGIKYIDFKNSDDTFTSKILLTYETYIDKVIALGISPVKKIAQTNAAEQALKWISENLNIVKYVPIKYKILPNKIW